MSSSSSLSSLDESVSMGDGIHDAVESVFSSFESDAPRTLVEINSVDTVAKGAKDVHTYVSYVPNEYNILSEPVSRISHKFRIVPNRNVISFDSIAYDWTPNRVFIVSHKPLPLKRSLGVPVDERDRLPFINNEPIEVLVESLLGLEHTAGVVLILPLGAKLGAPGYCFFDDFHRAVRVVVVFNRKNRKTPPTPKGFVPVDDLGDLVYDSTVGWVPSSRVNDISARRAEYAKHNETRPLKSKYVTDRIKKLVSASKSKSKRFYATLDVSSPRIPYVEGVKDHSKSMKLGQRKLLLTEINFLTRALIDLGKPRSPIHLIYIGAASGIHITVLYYMFRNVHFYLYDSNNFDKRLYMLGDRVKIFKQYFTQKDIDGWKPMMKENPNQVLFMSDIRSSSKDRTHEESVGSDNALQLEIVRALNPFRSLLKFRGPFAEYDEDDYFDAAHEVRPQAASMTYVDGAIFLQPYIGSNSAETRLEVHKNAGLRTYDMKRYEQQIAYHNTVTRFDDWTQYEPMYGYSWDTLMEYAIVMKYVSEMMHSYIYAPETVPDQLVVCSLMHFVPSSVVHIDSDETKSYVESIRKLVRTPRSVLKRGDMFEIVKAYTQLFDDALSGARSHRVFNILHTNFKGRL